MRDQAAELRNLVFRSMRRTSLHVSAPPPMIVVAGGRAGVGASTIAMNLALVLATNGCRVTLVNADQQLGLDRRLKGLEPTAEDWLRKRQDIHEILQRGPAGMNVVGRIWPPGIDSQQMLQTQPLLFKQMGNLKRHCDLILLDCGTPPGDVMAGFWQLALEVVLVTTPDPVSVMDTYALTKILVARGIRKSLKLVVNRATSNQLASDVQTRISQSCQRFLNQRIVNLGNVEDDPQVAQADRSSQALVLGWPDCGPARQIQYMAQKLLAELDGVEPSVFGAA